MVQRADTVFRDYVTDGVPSSGANDPNKADIRAMLTALENGVTGAGAGATIYDSKTDMDADTLQAANAMAWVLGDATAANNGIYQFDGASTWNRLGDLPYSYIKASNSGAGTANAIVATTSIPIPEADGGALIALPIVAENTASPVTVAFNGGATLTIKTSSGRDIAVGGLTSGMIVAGYVSGSTFRLLSDQASEAILAQMEAFFLGAHATAPTEDANGNQPQIGAIYYNTTDSVQYVWDGDNWVSLASNVADGAVTNSKVAPDAAIDADKLAITFDYDAGAPVTLPISAALKGGVARPEWAKKDSDGSNWQPAIQTIADALADASPAGGIVDVGHGSKNVDGTINMTAVGTHLEGRGGGDFMSKPPNIAAAPTTLVGVATAGDVVRVKTYGCSVRGMQITADATRRAAPYAVGKGGLRFEATDTGVGLERVGSSYVDDVRAINQPGDGILVVGDAVGTVISRSEGGGNKGHGICINGGGRTGRANQARPGIIDLYMCRSQRNGGHALAVGDPNTVGAGLPYRVRAYNFECFGNADDAAVRHIDAQVWAYGENLEFNLCAFGGMAADSTPDVHQGAYVAGPHARMRNSRFIGVTRALTIGQRAIDTTDFVVDGAYFNNASTVMNPAIVITAGATLIKVRAALSSYYNALVNTSGGVDIIIEEDALVTLVGQHFSVRDNTTYLPVFEVDTDGKAIGFFGKVPVGQQVLPTAASDAGTTQTLVNAIRTALKNLGLAV